MDRDSYKIVLEYLKEAPWAREVRTRRPSVYERDYYNEFSQRTSIEILRSRTFIPLTSRWEYTWFGMRDMNHFDGTLYYFIPDTNKKSRVWTAIQSRSSLSIVQRRRGQESL
jgi:hypothetical protein